MKVSTVASSMMMMVVVVVAVVIVGVVQADDGNGKPCQPLKTFGKCTFPQPGGVTRHVFNAQIILDPCYVQEFDASQQDANMPLEGELFSLVKFEKRGFRQNYKLPRDADGKEDYFCCGPIQPNSSIRRCLKHAGIPLAISGRDLAYTSGGSSSLDLAKIDRIVSADSWSQVEAIKITQDEDRVKKCQSVLAALTNLPATSDKKKALITEMERQLLVINHLLIKKSTVYSLLSADKKFLMKKTLTRLTYRLLSTFLDPNGRNRVTFDSTENAEMKTELETALKNIENKSGDQRKHSAGILMKRVKEFEIAGKFFGILEKRDAAAIALKDVETAITAKGGDPSTPPVDYRRKVRGGRALDPTIVAKQELNNFYTERTKQMAKMSQAKTEWDEFFAVEENKLVGNRLIRGSSGHVTYFDSEERSRGNHLSCAGIDLIFSLESQRFARHNKQNDKRTAAVQFTTGLVAAAASGAPAFGAAAGAAIRVISDLVTTWMKYNNAIRKFRRDVRSAYIGAYQKSLFDSIAGTYKPAEDCTKATAKFLKLAVWFLYQTEEELDKFFAPLEPCVKVTKEVQERFDRYIPLLEALSKAFKSNFVAAKFTDTTIAEKLAGSGIASSLGSVASASLSLDTFLHPNRDYYANTFWGGEQKK